MGGRGVALVTGASRGLGAVIAHGLAAQGWAVAVNYRAGTERAQDVVDQIAAAGGRAEMFAADVTDEADVADLVSGVAQRLGPVNVLVVNATGPQPNVGIEDLTWQAHLDQLLFFVKSPTLLLQAVLPEMKARRWGRVIQIGSDAFERALPGTSAYIAAKGAVGERCDRRSRAAGDDIKLSTGGLLNPLVYQRLCRLVGPLPDLPFVDIGAAGGSATIALARGYARSGKRSPILAIEKCRGGTSPQGRTGSANCRTPSWRRHAIVCDAGGSRPPGVIRWVKLRL
jgi:NADP-dependent 3-hydroxy acid dehydrogenase YdfG